MYNDFVIVGPTADPAKIAGRRPAATPFSAIARAQAPFASRGDKSGTHTARGALERREGDAAGARYRSLGQGMGETLVFANEQGPTRCPIAARGCRCATGCRTSGCSSAGGPSTRTPTPACAIATG